MVLFPPEELTLPPAASLPLGVPSAVEFTPTPFVVVFVPEPPKAPAPEPLLTLEILRLKPPATYSSSSLVLPP
jgi:hypothetical protein